MNEHESLLAAIHETVKLQDHDSSWTRVFAIEKSRLLSLLPDTFLGIQHIGSTAVTGLPAKPIIDILGEAYTHAKTEFVCAISAIFHR